MKALTYFVLSMTLLSLLIGCGDSSSSSSSSQGNLSIQMTDAPFPSDLVSEANVTIDKIEIRQSNNSDGNPFVTLSDQNHSFNLLKLTNGVTESLVNMKIDQGSYDLVRLHVSEASVVLSDGTTFDLTVPSGAQTGIKIFIDPAIDVVGGLSAELLLDFDVSQSFVVQGNPDTPAGINGFIFTPTIKASNISTSGRLTGKITDYDSGERVEGATVSVYNHDSGTLYVSTFSDDSDITPDNSGEYTVLGLPEGIYDIVVEYEGYSPERIDGVTITKGNVTTQDAQLTKL